MSPSPSSPSPPSKPPDSSADTRRPSVPDSALRQPAPDALHASWYALLTLGVVGAIVADVLYFKRNPPKLRPPPPPKSRPTSNPKLPPLGSRANIDADPRTFKRPMSTLRVLNTRLMSSSSAPPPRRAARALPKPVPPPRHHLPPPPPPRRPSLTPGSSPPTGTAPPHSPPAAALSEPSVLSSLSWTGLNATWKRQLDPHHDDSSPSSSSSPSPEADSTTSDPLGPLRAFSLASLAVALAFTAALAGTASALDVRSPAEFAAAMRALLQQRLPSFVARVHRVYDPSEHRGLLGADLLSRSQANATEAPVLVGAADTDEAHTPAAPPTPTASPWWKPRFLLTSPSSSPSPSPSPPSPSPLPTPAIPPPVDLSPSAVEARLADAFDRGGLPAWAEAAEREVELEGRMHRRERGLE